MMRVIIAGCRHFRDHRELLPIIDGIMKANGITPTEIVSGCAKGVDRSGEEWAKRNGVPIKPFPANWRLYGRSAGPIRNREMAKYADALIAIWDGKSRGTEDMIEVAREYCLDVYVHYMPA